jgi:hypothetical protein
VTKIVQSDGSHARLFMDSVNVRLETSCRILGLLPTLAITVLIGLVYPLVVFGPILRRSFLTGRTAA